MRAWCPEGGRRWDRVANEDQCPSCGRIVSVTLDDTTPHHIAADEAYHRQLDAENDRLYYELTTP